MGHAHSIRENPGQIAGIAALSATIGAIAAMLFTPRSGEQVRHGIGRQKDKLVDRMHSKADELSDKAEDLKNKTKDKTNKD